MPTYRHQYFEYEAGKPLASTRLTEDGPIILTAQGVSPKTFFAYLTEGNSSPSSEQKRVVLKRIERAGYSLEALKSLLCSPQRVFRFLILHELSHINHNDFVVYQANSDLLDPQKIEVEVRATLKALTQLETEISPPKPKMGPNRPTAS